MRTLTGLVITVATMIAAAAVADEEKVPLDKVPKPVLEAVKKRFPNGEIKNASTEKEDDKVVFEISVKEGGKNIDLTLTSEGAIKLIEQEIDAKDAPKAVVTAVKEKFPKAMWTMIEKVIKVEGGRESIDYFEFHGTVDGKEVEAEVTADGKIKKTTDKKEEKKGMKDRD